MLTSHPQHHIYSFPAYLPALFAFSISGSLLVADKPSSTPYSLSLYRPMFSSPPSSPQSPRSPDEEADWWGGRRGRTGSGEMLSPGPRSPSRKSTLPVAVFNLVSTIIGGGVLSLPWSFAKAGLIPGILSILVAAGMSDFSVYILVAAARRSGAQSFEELAQKAFGSSARLLMLLLLFSLTYVCCIACTLQLIDKLVVIRESPCSRIPHVHMHTQPMVTYMLVL